MPGMKRMRTESTTTESARAFTVVSFRVDSESEVMDFMCCVTLIPGLTESLGIAGIGGTGGTGFFSRSCADRNCRMKNNEKPTVQVRMRQFKISPVRVCGSVEMSALSGKSDTYWGTMKGQRLLLSRFQTCQRPRIRCRSSARTRLPVR